MISIWFVVVVLLITVDGYDYEMYQTAILDPMITGVIMRSDGLAVESSFTRSEDIRTGQLIWYDNVREIRLNIDTR